MVKLSIVIPVYNVEHYLDECVSSLYNQDIHEEDFEVLLIDDGSTDNSLSIAKQWAEKHGNVRVFHQENQGQGPARNLGIDNAIGDYICFVDSDDWLTGGKLGNVLEIAFKENLDIIYFGITVERSDGSFCAVPTFRRKNSVIKGEEYLFSSIPVGSVWGAFYKHSLICKHDLRFMRGITHEDVPFAHHVLAYAQRILVSDIFAYNYRYNPHSTDRSREVSKIKKGILSNFHVAKYLRDLSKKEEFSTQLRGYYRRKCNSIVVSEFINMKKTGVADVYFIKECIDVACKLGVYPIKGRTLSWKTTLLIPFINIKWLLSSF